MIEKWIKNELTLRRYRRFKSRRAAMISLWFLVGLSFFSFTAEIWSNSRPIILHYQGVYYFPVLRDYHPSRFGNAEQMRMDYRKLELGAGDWQLLPPNPWDPFESNTSVATFPAPPSRENRLGTDDRGRDILARLLYGFRESFKYAISVFVVSYLLGILIGAAMGYHGGKVDLLGQRLLEVWESLPVLMVLLTLITVFKPSLGLLVLISSLFGWMSISIYVRAEFLKLRRREFVEAGKSLGLSSSRIVFRHILPNALGPVLTFAPFVISGGIASLAVLDFLGFGLQPPIPSWGELLSQAKSNFTIAWWLALYPSLALFFTLLFLSLIGDAVREAFDPHSH